MDRLQFIASAKHLGLPLEEIAELLDIWQSGACSDVLADLRPRVAARIGAAEDRLAELRAFTDSLRSALEHLDALPDRSGRCDPECGFLNSALSSRSATPLVTLPNHSPAPVLESLRLRLQSVACSLTDGGVSERAERWKTLLQDASREQIPGGVRLILPAARVGEVAALAYAEQQCCPFFEFQIGLEGAVMTMQVRAPQEASMILADLFG